MSESSGSNHTLADYVATAIGPALIMALIGSLVFFLVEVLYIGEFYGRLLWFFFFYIFGCVLVARISMGEFGNRAGLYGSVLALLMWVALLIHVEFPRESWAGKFGWAIHLGLILLVWWSAHKLTRDSTLDEEKADASGRGLLDAAGLDKASANTEADPAEAEGKRQRRRGRDGGLVGWWERYQRYREEKKQRPRTHGVWVVYFSLAALPLFGLGQALIPPEHTGRRQYAFWLMCVYVASGLGLLLTTTFLGLRRYLRHKRLRMPIAVTTTWLFSGATLTVALLAAGGLMPRPYPEYSLSERFLGIASPQRNSSDWAIKRDDGSADQERATGSSSDRPTDKSGNSGRPDPGGDKGQAQGKQGEPGGSSNSGQPQQGPGNTGGNDGQKQGDNKQGQDNNKGQDNKKGSGGQGGSGQNQGSREGDKKQANGTKSSGSSSSPSAVPQTPPPNGDWLSSISGLLKWIVLGIVAVIIGYYLLRSGLGFLANFTLWARGLLNWWQALWSRQQKTRLRAKETPAAPKPVRPFRWFRDPFQSGNYRTMSDAELIRYSFAALEAWGREHGLERPTGQTPLEYAERVATRYAALEQDSRHLANHYATAAYAPARLDLDCADDLRRFWGRLVIADKPAEVAAV